jgi:hypothetical protein
VSCKVFFDKQIDETKMWRFPPTVNEELNK